MAPEIGGLIAVVVFVSLYALLMWGALRWARSRLLMRARLAAGSLTAVGARVLEVRPSPAFGRPAEVDFELDGKRALFDVRHYGRDFILCSVKVECHPLPAILVRAESAADRAGKAFGLSREVQLGDADFDAAAFIVAAAPDELVRSTLRSPEVQRHVREVLALGYQVVMSRDGLRATHLQYALRPFDGAPVPAVMRALEALVAALPRVDPATLTAPRLPSPIGPLLAVFGFAFVGFTTMMVSLPVVHPPVDDLNSLRAMGLGLIPWLLVTAIVVRALRGRTQSVAEVFLLALGLFIGVPALTATGLFAANSGLDHGAAVRHTERVVLRQRRDSELYVTPWEPGHDRQKIGVPRAVWNDTAVGDTVEFELHPGALGWPWVTDVRKVP